MRFPGMLRVSGSLLKLFDRLVEYLDSLEHKTALIPMQWGHRLFKCPVHARILPSSRIVAEDMHKSLWMRRDARIRPHCRCKPSAKINHFPGQSLLSMEGRTDPLYKIDNSLWTMSHAGIRCAETVPPSALGL